MDHNNGRGRQAPVNKSRGSKSDLRTHTSSQRSDKRGQPNGQGKDNQGQRSQGQPSQTNKNARSSRRSNSAANVEQEAFQASDSPGPDSASSNRTRSLRGGATPTQTRRQNDAGSSSSATSSKRVNAEYESRSGSYRKRNELEYDSRSESSRKIKDKSPRAASNDDQMPKMSGQRRSSRREVDAEQCDARDSTGKTTATSATVASRRRSRSAPRSRESSRQTSMRNSQDILEDEATGQNDRQNRVLNSSSLENKVAGARPSRRLSGLSEFSSETTGETSGTSSVHVDRRRRAASAPRDLSSRYNNSSSSNNSYSRDVVESHQFARQSRDSSTYHDTDQTNSRPFRNSISRQNSENEGYRRSGVVEEDRQSIALGEIASRRNSGYASATSPTSVTQNGRPMSRSISSSASISGYTSSGFSRPQTISKISSRRQSSRSYMNRGDPVEEDNGIWMNNGVQGQHRNGVSPKDYTCETTSIEAHRARLQMLNLNSKPYANIHSSHSQISTFPRATKQQFNSPISVNSPGGFSDRISIASGHRSHHSDHPHRSSSNHVIGSHPFTSISRVPSQSSLTSEVCLDLPDLRGDLHDEDDLHSRDFDDCNVSAGFPNAPFDKIVYLYNRSGICSRIFNAILNAIISFFFLIPFLVIFAIILPVVVVLKKLFSWFCCCGGMWGRCCVCLCHAHLSGTEVMWLGKGQRSDQSRVLVQKKGQANFVAQSLVVLQKGLDTERIRNLIDSRLLSVEDSNGKKMYPRFTQKVCLCVCVCVYISVYMPVCMLACPPANHNGVII